MKKKILFVIDSLVCGGAEKSLVSLLPLLNRNKYELYIWIIHRGGDFEILLPKDVVVVDSPKYSLLEKIYLEVGQILFSLLLRINKIFSIKEHNAEALWKSIGWAIKVPKGSWNTVIAYQQGLPTYLVANKFSSCKKYAWINVNIFEAGYNIEFNDQFYEKIDNIVSVSEKLYDLLSEKMPKFNSKYTLIYDMINVLKGDMALIGPRPLLVQYLPLYSKEQARRHDVRPGITGWAQVNGRNAISWTKKFELDVWYVDHCSFWLDVKIIFLTIKKVFVREGISQEGQATMEFFTGNN